MDILIDFDGTCVKHEFPKVGADIGSVPYLLELVRCGHNLILFTMRSNRKYKMPIADPTIQDVDGNFLDDAIEWFKKNDIPLYGIQKNPTQHQWTTSPKAYGQLMIDDSALGCPLKRDKPGDSPYVDWEKVGNYLIGAGLISKNFSYTNV